MSEERPQASQPVTPISSLEDPRAITLLTTEHWSLLLDCSSIRHAARLPSQVRST